MKRQIMYMTLILWLALIVATPSVMAASFDLVLNGHWAYTDLATLADAGLLEDHSSRKELAALFPLTRYEVALLVGEVLAPKALDPWQAEISADTLMWEIMGNAARGEEIDLSYEVVAKARQDSESVYRALARLAQEFAKELDALGLTGKWPETSSLSLAPRASITPRKALASLGVTQLLATVPSVFAGANGFTLSDGLRIEVVPPATSTSGHDMAQANKEVEPVTAAAKRGFSQGEERVRNRYAPVDITALSDQPIEPQALQALSVESEVELPEGGSLKLQPHMNGGRPTGLLTSYFLDRAHN